MGNWTQQFELIMPEVLLLVGGLALLLIGAVTRGRRAPKWIAAFAGLVLLAALMAVVRLYGELPQGVSFSRILPRAGDTVQTAFMGNIVVDGLALIFKVIALVGAAIVVLMATRYAERFRNGPEFYALVIFATLAATLLCSAADLVLIYLSFEFLSITSYVLVCYLKFQPRSTEAAIKYLLYGAIAAAVMLYGLSLLYGAAGTTALYGAPGFDKLQLGTRNALLEVIPAIARDPSGGPLLIVATLFILVGLGFKTGAAPFHQWVPDVYDGSPLPVMAWLTVTSSAAGFAAFIRVFVGLIPPQYWLIAVLLISALTMTLGNFIALSQTNIKRMMAYSSIAHGGYTLMGLAALGAAVQSGVDLGENVYVAYAVPIYMATYVFMNLGALSVITAVYQKIRSHRIDDYRGLSESAPGLAYAMMFFLLSLAGLPPTAGFFGKFFLFSAAVNTDLMWLAILAFLNSVVSVGYYWYVVRVMFLRPTDDLAPIRPGFGLRAAVGVSAVMTLALLVYAAQFLRLLSNY